MKNAGATCCREFASTEPMISPFTRQLIFDWYDGVVNGVVQCETCGTSWFLDLRAWDGSANLFVYIAAELPLNSFCELSTLLVRLDGHDEGAVTIVPAHAAHEVDNWTKRVAVIETSRQFVLSATDIGREIKTSRRVPVQDRVFGPIQLTDFSTIANLDPTQRLRWLRQTES